MQGGCCRTETEVELGYIYSSSAKIALEREVVRVLGRARSGRAKDQSVVAKNKHERATWRRHALNWRVRELGQDWVNWGSFVLQLRISVITDNAVFSTY